MTMVVIKQRHIATAFTQVCNALDKENGRNEAQKQRRR